MPELFPHVPASVTEILDFLTDVRSHPSGEVRDSLRDATQVLELGFSMSPAEARDAVARVRANPAGEWYVPVWPDVSWVDASVAAGAGSIGVSTDADYRAGGLAIVLKSYLECELVEVASASGGTLTLAGSPTIAASYDGPLLVAPVGTYLLLEGFRTSGEFSVIRGLASFRRVDNEDLGASSLATYLSSPVLDAGTVLSSPLDGAVARALEVIDSGFGTVALEAVEGYVRQRSVLSFADADPAARWARKRLLHYLRGRDRAFWLPSFRRDFTVSTAFSSTLLRAADVDYPDVPGLVGRSIEIDTGSSRIHRAISAAAVVGSELQLTLSTAPGTTVPVSARVSLMTLQRLDADRVQLDHEFIGGGFVSRCRVPTVEVPA